MKNEETKAHVHNCPLMSKIVRRMNGVLEDYFEFTSNTMKVMFE